MSVSVHHASMLDWLAAYDGSLFDSCVTDPPYHLTSIVQRFGKAGSAEAKDRDGLFKRASRGFMGKEWDGGDVAFRVETWQAVLAALKPGAHLIAFSGTRTYHRMACAIEDAGFEIRDQLAWAYGTGFPKNHAVGQGWGTALKPAWEPICLARKPLAEKSVAAQIVATGTGGINVDGCRVQAGDPPVKWDRLRGGRWKPSDGQSGVASTLPNFDGRYPANLCHDGSEAVLAGFPDTDSGGGPAIGTPRTQQSTYGKPNANNSAPLGANSGSAARFFYSAKAGPLDRIGTTHATVKPVDLMRWLCRLVTPAGGRVLEPFAGSGTTGIACLAEQFDCTMIELEADHVADIERKLTVLRGEGRLRFIEHDRQRDARGSAEGADHGPLFA